MATTGDYSQWSQRVTLPPYCWGFPMVIPKSSVTGPERTPDVESWGINVSFTKKKIGKVVLCLTTFEWTSVRAALWRAIDDEIWRQKAVHGLLGRLWRWNNAKKDRMLLVPRFTLSKKDVHVTRSPFNNYLGVNLTIPFFRFPIFIFSIPRMIESK